MLLNTDIIINVFKVLFFIFALIALVVAEYDFWQN